MYATSWRIKTSIPESKKKRILNSSVHPISLHVVIRSRFFASAFLCNSFVNHFILAFQALHLFPLYGEYQQCREPI
jgi:hypothetical protein